LEFSIFTFTCSYIELFLIVLIVLIGHIVFTFFKLSFSFFVYSAVLLAPLGLGALLSLCVLYLLSTNVDICELVHLTTQFKVIVEHMSVVSFTRDNFTATNNVCVNVSH